MHRSARLCVVTAAILVAAACSNAGHEMTVIEATYGANCGAPAGNVTAAVAAACDGRFSCSYAITNGTAAAPAVECAKDFAATWRCATEEGVRSSRFSPEAAREARLDLGCQGRPAGRIEILTVTLADAPVPGLTAAVDTRCSGRQACSVTPADVAPRAHIEPPADNMRVFWRCEGEMTMRETAATAAGPASLGCN